MKKIIAISALLSLGGVVQADAQPVTLLLNSASTLTQGIALVLSNQMQAQGGKVHILMCDKAADLALKSHVGEKLRPQDVTPGQLLDSAMKKGATASVCALYLPNSGHAADQLKDGIAPAKPDAMAREVMEANRKVLVF